MSRHDEGTPPVKGNSWPLDRMTQTLPPDPVDKATADDVAVAWAAWGKYHTGYRKIWDVRKALEGCINAVLARRSQGVVTTEGLRTLRSPEEVARRLEYAATPDQNGIAPPLQSLLREAASLLRSQGEADADKVRMDWLEQHVVNVLLPLVYGSRNLFWASPEDMGGGPDGPSDIRQQIDRARSGKAKGGEG